MKNLIFALLNWSASSAMLGQFFTMMLITAGVAVLIYCVTRFLAVSRRRMGLGRRSGNLRVVESIAVTSQSMVQLVKAGEEKYLVIGVTKERINLLAVLTKEEVDEPEEPDMGAVAVPFNKVLQRFLPQAKDGQRDEDMNE